MMDRIIQAAQAAAAEVQHARQAGIAQEQQPGAQARIQVRSVTIPVSGYTVLPGVILYVEQAGVLGTAQQAVSAEKNDDSWRACWKSTMRPSGGRSSPCLASNL